MGNHESTLKQLVSQTNCKERMGDDVEIHSSDTKTHASLGGGNHSSVQTIHQVGQGWIRFP